MMQLQLLQTNHYPFVSDDGSSKEVSAFGNEPKKSRWETKEERKEEKAVETPSAGNSAGERILKSDFYKRNLQFVETAYE